MSDYICENLVHERKNGLVLSYTLKENQYFFQTAFKILQRKENENFIKCYKSIWNGKVKLSYSLEKYHTLFNFEAALSNEQYYLIIQNIMRILDDFRTNGLMQIETIDLAYDKIFFDDNLNVRLICVPLAISSTSETLSMFDYITKKLVIEIIEKSGYGKQIEFEMIYKDCQNIQMNISDICSNFNMKKYVSEINIENDTRIIHTEGMLQLKGINTTEQISIDQNLIVLGKSPEMSNKVVTGSSSVSRRHCQITKEFEKYYIEDLKSLNHTYVNGIMLHPGEQIELHPGDHLRLADLEFELM